MTSFYKRVLFIVSVRKFDYLKKQNYIYYYLHHVYNYLRGSINMQRNITISIAVVIIVLSSISAVGVYTDNTLSSSAGISNLQVEVITGGTGISAMIRNTGIINLTNISWEITFTGGLIFVGKNTLGIIPLLRPDAVETIQVHLVLGFGKPVINVSAQASEGDTTSKINRAHITGVLVRILPGDPGAFTATLNKIISGLISPTLLTNAGDQSNRLFIGEQTGKIHIFKNGSLLKTPFLDLTTKIVKLSKVYDERGLLGLVFHPDYKDNGRFFVYYNTPSSDTSLNCDSILAEYAVSTDNPDIADPASEKILLHIGEPEMNHNGGQLAFGPDGFLYIGVGDGGGAGDQHGSIGNGQNKSVLLGKILRIDINNGTPYGIPSDNPFVGQDGSDEIYAYGFRNPFRFSFDAITGRLFVADVGQDLWEEIDLVLNGGNYGWRIMEGNHPYDLALATTLNISLDSLQYPIFDYSHDVGHSIIGGYVYHGSASPAVEGSYVFGDWSTDFVKPRGKLYYLSENTTGIWHQFEFNLKNQKPLNRFILGIGEDESSELYLLTSWATGTVFPSGEVWRIQMD
jgi:glucose/arabinose dehydrogenase